jgi:hypothetical protein
MADVIRFLVNLVQLQANNDPAAAMLAKSVKVGVTGTTLDVTASIPESQVEQLTAPKPHVARRRPLK